MCDTLVPCSLLLYLLFTTLCCTRMTRLYYARFSVTAAYDLMPGHGILPFDCVGNLCLIVEDTWNNVFSLFVSHVVLA